MHRGRPLAASLALLALCAAAPALATETRISGALRTAAGDGLSNATVELVPIAPGYAAEVARLGGAAPAAPIASVRSRDDGSYMVLAPERGLYRVIVRADGLVAMERPVFQLLDDTMLPDVTLTPAAALDVQAVGGDGKPLAGVEVVALSGVPQDNGWRPATRRALTSPDGRVKLPRR
ncbi:MAG TPA: hypothetical protein VGE98_06510, partial [Thermoanaerobaculia bacterium]